MRGVVSIEVMVHDLTLTILGFLHAPAHNSNSIEALSPES